MTGEKNKYSFHGEDLMVMMPGWNLREGSRGERGIPDKIRLVGGSEQFGRRLGRKFGSYLAGGGGGGDVPVTW